MAIDRLRGALGRTVLVWQPDDAMATERRAGWRRVWTGPSTAWLDLTPPPALLRKRLDAKWRNKLTQAEATSMSAIEAVGGSHFEWLVEANERQRLAVGYRAPGAGFIRALAASGRRGMLALVARHEGTPVAGVLLARHGRAATYYAGVTTAAGRRLRAHHILLWEGVLRLQRAGCTALDLGGIDTVTSPGIARFKLGLGGTPLTLAGSYLVAPRLRRVPG
ncbi:MAG: GNAT family N-acetyltransferase [Geminicoccaceae bacterium]